MMTMKNNLRLNGLKGELAIILMVTTLMTGCAANMAANGQNGPDLQIVQQEKSRREIEHYLGTPETVLTHDNGHSVATYDVEAKTKPSIARAAGHGAMDLLTLGLWEFVGGPAEMYMGRRVLVSVEYDREGKLIALDSVRYFNNIDSHN